MSKKKDMSESELEIMGFLWKQKEGVGLREICEYFNSKENKGWKQQTVRAFLLRLKDKGYINIYVDTDTNKYIYLPKNSKEEYLQEITKKLLNKFFNGSIHDFMSAFTGGKKLTNNEAKQLKAFLEEEE
ncbi:MAG: BlaI/MecI/CopY family transcriptional regulator [Clostridia bacterium]|nr:BlaI/MecI/CopY family transcriptional regulator [Clostridia bacterium]